MYYKLLFTSLMFFFLSIDMLLCQNTRFGITGNVGLSKIDYDLGELENKKDKLRLSSNLGLFFEKKLKQKSGLGAKLLWVSLKGETEVSDIELFTINPETLMREPLGSRTSFTTFHLNYIGVPIYYLYNTKKLTLNAGIQTMFLINASSRFREDVFFNDEAPRILSEGDNNFEFKRIDVGATIGVSYALSKKLSLTSSLYYGLLNVDKNSSSSEKKNRQITLGLNYYLKK